jgi:hypothetical protein
VKITKKQLVSLIRESMYNTNTLQRIKNLVKAERGSDYDDDFDDEEEIEVFKHPVIPNVYGAVAGNSGWVIFDGKDPTVLPTEDVSYGKENFFLEVTIAADGTWSYPGEDYKFHCFKKDKNGNYVATRFHVGEKVYPVIFHENTAGGWTVFDSTGEYSEYWQCE